MKLMETEIVRPNATTTRIRLRYLVEEKETVLVVAVDVPWTARTSGKIMGQGRKKGRQRNSATSADGRSQETN